MPFVFIFRIDSQLVSYLLILFDVKNKKLGFIEMPKIETAPRVGIDSRKEILAESYLLNFKILAAVITMPDLLTPGINERIWKIPTKITAL